MNTITESTQTHPTRAAQINIRLTAEQQCLLKQHCVRNSLATQEAGKQALQDVIVGF